MNHANPRWRATAYLTTTVFLLSPLAHAQGSASDKAAAEGLFDEGKRLMESRNYADACKRLEESQRLDAGVGTLLYLGACYEKAGLSASAWATYREAASEAKNTGQADREKIARSRAAALEPTLSKLTCEVAKENDIAGFELRRDGHPLGKGTFGLSIPTDPGPHVLEATAPGKRPYRNTVQVSGGGASTTTTIPALEDDPNARSAETRPAPAGSTVVSFNEPGTADKAEHDGTAARTAGYVLGGVGIVALGAGTYWGVTAISKNHKASTLCSRPNDTCDQSGVDYGDEAKKNATLSTVALTLGGAALIGGIVLLVTNPPRTNKADISMSPFLARDAGGVSLTGRF